VSWSPEARGARTVPTRRRGLWVPETRSGMARPRSISASGRVVGSERVEVDVAIVGLAVVGWVRLLRGTR